MLRESTNADVSLSWLEVCCYTLVAFVLLIGVEFFRFSPGVFLLPTMMMMLSLGIRFYQKTMDSIRGGEDSLEADPSEFYRIVQPEVRVFLPRFNFEITIRTDPGFVYIMKRSDGILKLGKTNNPYQRLRQHTSGYGKEFELVRRFSVPDMRSLERVALQLTVQYHYNEPGRVELRKMSNDQLDKFLDDFSEICKEVIDK